MGALISCLISLGTERIDAALLMLPIPLLPFAAKTESKEGQMICVEAFSLPVNTHTYVLSFTGCKYVVKMPDQDSNVEIHSCTYTM